MLSWYFYFQVFLNHLNKRLRAKAHGIRLPALLKRLIVKYRRFLSFSKAVESLSIFLSANHIFVGRFLTSQRTVGVLTLRLTAKRFITLFTS